MSILKNGKVSRAARLGVVLTLATAGVVGLSTSSQAASTTLSPTYGASGATVVLGLTASGLKSPNGTTTYVDTALDGTSVWAKWIYFSTATCPKTKPSAEATTTTGARAVTVDSPTHMVLTTPAITVTTKTDYNLCVFATTNALLATAKYSVYPNPTFVSLSTDKGKTAGGQTITVEGTNFTSKTAVTLDGVAMTSVKVAKDGLSLTAVTPARPAASNVVLSITDEGGNVTNATFDYVNAITISPSSFPVGTMTNVTIRGSGFNALTFVSGETAGHSDLANGHLYTNSANAHVYVVQQKYTGINGYDGTNYAAAVNKDNGQVGECLTPIVVNDTTITCTLDTTDSYAALNGAYTWSGTDLAAASYTVAVVNNGSIAAPTFVTAVTSGSTITVSPF